MGVLTEFRLKILGFIAAFFILVILPPLLTSYWLTILIQMLIYAVLAMSLNILMGYTGLASFGHCAYFGTSAYAVAILSTKYKVGFLGCVSGGLFAALFVAAIFGLIVAHTQGVYFLMITLALGMVIFGLAYRWVTMTGGDNGIAGIYRPEIGLSLSLDEPIVFYYMVLIVFLLVMFFLYIFHRSPFGQSLLGIRESESRMRNLGYNTWLHKYLAFIIAGGVSGISGILWAYYNGFVSPMDVELTASFEAFLMVILGGAGTLVGPAVGAGLIVFLKNFISAYTERWLLFIGAIYILTIMYSPGGLAELVKRFVKGGDRK
ncbi:MAG: branched-chain amino acid ABC transporter permease [Deltaproteobacteria bacterium]|nr:branched-chain amino acid ABC transporter permease [Deltaproteobacteria bacterium]MBW2208139.1 branched-chain amino acid ABC transporter permease [Deltaproteobacteria bacterium]